MPVLPDSLAIVILAGGGGSRIGGGKLLLPWRGRPILAHTLAAAAGIRCARGLFVVTGFDSQRVRRAVREATAPDMPPVHTLENALWRDGQSSSLRCAIETIMKRPDMRGTGGAMIVLGDQPSIRPETLNLLAERHLGCLAEKPEHLATAPFFRNKRGNPVILSPDLYPSIMRLEGDVGARYILAALGAELLSVPVDDPGVLQDVDTPDDYETLQREL